MNQEPVTPGACRVLWLLFLLAGVSVVVLSHLVTPLDPAVKTLSLLNRASTGGAWSGLKPWRVVDIALVATLMLWIACHTVLWRTGRGPSCRMDTRTFLFASLVGAGLWLAQLIAVPWTSGDIFLYLAHSSTWAEFGDNPYVVAPAANPANPFWQLATWRTQAAQYGPLGILIGAGLLKASSGPWGSLVLSRLFGIGCLAGAFLCAGGIARDLRLRIGRGTWLLLATSPLLLAEVGAAAHNETWVVLPLLASIWAGLRGRWGLALALLAASVAVKYSTLVLLPIFAFGLWRSPPRGALRWLELATGCLVIALGAVLLSRLFGGVEVIAEGFSRAARLRTKSIVWMLCYGAEALGFSAGPIVTTSRVVVVVLVLVLGWRVKRPAVAPKAILATYLLFLIFGVAWFQPWYVVVLLPVCPLVAARGARDVAVLFAASSMLGVYGVYFLVRSWSPPAQIAMTLITFVPVLLALRKQGRTIVVNWEERPGPPPPSARHIDRNGGL
jgi:hypothetical protein